MTNKPQPVPPPQTGSGKPKPPKPNEGWPHWTCTCPSFEYRPYVAPSGRKFCKHLIALTITDRAQRAVGMIR